MTGYNWVQFVFFAGLLIALSPLLGKYIAFVFEDRRTFMHAWLQPLEKVSYKIGGIDPFKEMHWWTYAKTLLLFNFLGFLAVFLLQILQNFIPLNPQNFPGVPLLLAFNTAISFVTNTNWQAYAGETTLSYATQMLGLSVQNFLSAATGMAVLLVLIRGFVRKTSATVGNFWADLIRGVVYIFIPLAIIWAIALVGQGVVQSFSPYLEVTTIENATQTIPLGPVASQEAIKLLGTNGGGFFSANSAHPFENPTGFSNFLESFALLLIPASLIHAYGMMIRSKKHAWLIFGVMGALWLVGLFASIYSESLHNPVLGVSPLLEGKETRFGMANSILWSISTTSSANGSVNAMMSSLSPLSGGIALFNILIGELIFGGVGVGLASMIMFILLTVFFSGLMVGRTPEYLGKKIEKHEMQWMVVAIMGPSALILLGAGFFCVLPGALSSLGNHGPHGLTEILYAFASSAGNNGSSFAGLNANTGYFNITLGIVMLLGRLSIIVPSLAIGGLLAQKKIAPPSSGTFSTNTFLFALLLFFVILIVAALTFFPPLSLGPVMEQLLMLEGRSF